METAELDRLQVLLEAKNHWLKIKQTTRNDLDAVYDRSIRLKGFSAYNALKKVMLDDYPGHPFWETADMAQLEESLIIILNGELGSPDGYANEMRRRNGATA